MHSLVIHCEGRFSRSAGVVASLKELYGYEVEDARLVQENQSVTIIIVKAAKKDEGKQSASG
jgi:protein-tyrosine phosphatase